MGSEDRSGAVQETFDVWYAREHPRLVASLLLITGELDLAAEGVDEAFARALERWGRVRTMDSPTGWAFKVALNHVRRLQRRRTMERGLLLRRRTVAHVLPPAGEIWHLVADLPLRQRQIVVLRHVGDLREAEIAQILGISRSTVSSSLSDAHERLGHLIRDEET